MLFRFPIGTHENHTGMPEEKILNFTTASHSGTLFSDEHFGQVSLTPGK